MAVAMDCHLTDQELAEKLEDKVYVGWITQLVLEGLQLLVHKSIGSGDPLPERFSFACSNGETYQAHIYDWPAPRCMAIKVIVPLCSRNMEIDVRIEF
jgi:hypothetical protein